MQMGQGVPGGLWQPRTKSSSACQLVTGSVEAAQALTNNSLDLYSPEKMTSASQVGHDSGQT